MSLVRTLQGSFHQGSPRFFRGGSQCTAIAFFALALFFTYDLTCNLSSGEIDNILIQGDNLYGGIIRDLGHRENTYLAHYEMPNTVVVAGVPLNAITHSDILFGVVGENNLAHDIGATNLMDALETGFYVSDHLLATFQQLSIAISFNRNSGHYFVFDSHSRNIVGQHDPFGSAVLLEFSDVDSLLAYLTSEYTGSIYNISPVLFNYQTASSFEQMQHNQSENTDNGGSFDQTLGTSIHTENTCSFWDEDTINLNSFQSFSQRSEFQSTLNCNSIGQEKTDECLLESYFKSERRLHDFIQHVNLTTALTLEQEGPGEAMHLNNHFNRSLTEHSYCCPEECKRRKRRGKYTKNKRICNNSVSDNSSVLQEAPKSVILNVNFDDNYTLVSECVEVNTIYENSSEQMSIPSHNSISENFFREIKQTPSFTCSSCDRILYCDQVQRLKGNFQLTQAYEINAGSTVCSFCHSHLKKNEMPPFNSVLNALDPGNIPSYLKNLTYMEKRLLSKIQVFMTVVILPGGQLAEKGLAIDFPIDLQQQVSVLPQTFKNSNVITVSYENNNVLKPTHLVRKEKLLQALLWLKANNEIYANISLNFSHIPEGINIENDLALINNTYEEYAVIPSDYVMPHIDIETLLNSDIPHLSLKRCKSTPLNAYDTPKGEEMAFPHLFPLGVNGFGQERAAKLTASKYFKCRMYYKDGRFRKDISYLLHAVNYYEKERLLNAVSIHMRMRKSTGLLTAADVNDISSNPDLLQNSYMFMKFMKGTAAYWKNNLLNLLAMFKCLGPPSLFVTLSANDMHWPDLIMSLQCCSYDTACKMTNCLHLVKNDPVLTALHFQRRFRILLKDVILGPLMPLGKVVDYFARVEFQNRGSPHYHIFFWIENFSEIFGDHKQLVKYINDVISTKHTTSQFASKYQTHHHSDYCLRKTGRCRFGFPFREMKETCILSNVDLQSNVIKGKFYETERTADDCYINAFNPIILNHWQANMDIQVIGNCESAAYYVCAYLCKAEPENLKFELSKVIQNLNKITSLSQCSRMLKIGYCVLKSRKLSAQEAAYRLLPDLNLIISSRTVQTLNTKPQEKRFRVLKSKQEREELDDTSTDIFYNNVIDYYHARPNELLHLCLFEFSQWYVKCADKHVDISVASSNKQPRIKLKPPFQHIVMRKRLKSLVIRLPKLSLSSDDYFYSLLMCFLPHQNEEELLQRNETSKYNTARDAFISKRQNMQLEFLESATLVDEIENAVRFIQCSVKEMEAFIAPSTSEHVHVDDDCLLEDPSLSIPHPNNLHDVDFQMNSDLQGELSCENSDELHMNEISSSSISFDEIQTRIARLTRCQKSVMRYIFNHFKNKDNSEQLCMFISGGAGVGKSYLTRLIIDWLNCCCPIICGKSPVMVCASTGTAARNILGITIHSALYLPVQHGNQPNFNELSGKSLKKLRFMYSYVHTLIIDEISMVSAKTFEYIHRRLTSIKDNDKPFGNLNVIVIGDFLQLRPVKGKYVFENPILWSIFKPFILKENVRQSEDITYASLLNRARVGLLNEDDLKILQSRLIQPPKSDISSLLHLFPTLKEVQEHNNKMQVLLSRECIEVRAKHYFSQDDIEKKGPISDDDIPVDDRNAGGLPTRLQISIGTRVMLIKNIYTSKGLVNGALGYVELIEMHQEMNGEVNLIYVKFDDPNIGGVLKRITHNNAIAIEPLCQEFYYNGRIFVREQFPLIQAWATTIHKVQGASLSQAVISIGNNVFENGMAYVALSRIKKLSGLYLLALNSQKITPPIKALEEYVRLNSLTE